MCGICGVVTLGGDRRAERSWLWNMCATLGHRGPDDWGAYFDDRAMLGVRRLSVIDPATGRQPVKNEDETLHLVFNGELYNYRELRAELENQGHRFTTQSDSEVVVHAYEAFGEKCLDRFSGMFAFAIWDAVRSRLFLARDRIGIKPLYYWTDPNQIVFGSELSALVRHPKVPREIDLAALDQFLTVEYIPSPRTILQGVRKVPPGHWLRFDGSGVQLASYWDVPRRPFSGDKHEAMETLSGLVADAVDQCLVSDVPLGALLSGGVDSSTIVAFMSRAVDQPVRTFSIGFDEQSYDELPFARQVSSRFGTLHQEEVLRPDLGAMAEELVRHLDEPLGDFSIIPTYLVSKMAGRSVKVALSGDGGDELFCGYDAYLAQQADGYYRWLPAMVRQGVLPALLDRVPPQPVKKGVVNKAKRFVEGGSLPSEWQHVRWMTFMNDAHKSALYQPDLKHELNGSGALSFIEPHFQRCAEWDPLAQLQYVDLKTYLADNILTKLDRMSMAASIEARPALLDHRLVEFALNLPPHWKLNRGRTKIILREMMRGRLPSAILKRPKKGFSIPLKNWLRGPMRPLLTEVLSASSVAKRSYFEPQTVTRWIGDHLAGRVDHSHRLWALIVLELWSRKMDCVTA
ncbi:MAG TPA: asparagine synthase (glutamine-hydrolyzing) [Acidobacteriota bacterium]|nr:asparagine synthase (glutamine-hydrolyzing) [Acidobacteriota bacterium]